MVLDIAKKKEEQIAAAVQRIQGIADTIDQAKMIRMAKVNYDSMVKKLQGYLVWTEKFSRNFDDWLAYIFNITQ